MTFVLLTSQVNKTSTRIYYDSDVVTLKGGIHWQMDSVTIIV